MWSMTSVVTGPRVGSSFRPSCACSAVKMVGPDGSDADGGAASQPLGISAPRKPCVSSEANWRVMSYLLVSPVLSTMVRRSWRGGKPTTADMNMAWPLTDIAEPDGPLLMRIVTPPAGRPELFTAAPGGGVPPGP